MKNHSIRTTRSHFLDFELEIGIGMGREYPVAVVHSPAGEARDTMHFPYDKLVLESRLKDLQIALLRSGGKRRLSLSPEALAVQEFGQVLFDALFKGEVLNRYVVSLNEAIRQNKGLRLKLSIQSPELSALPWEFLYDSRQAEYVCLSRNTPVVRYLRLPQPSYSLTVTSPLRILGMVASPKDSLPLDVKREKRRIEQAAKYLKAHGQVNLTWVEGQTWRDLQQAMLEGPWHVFHFIGHGGFDYNTEEGFIDLANEEGQTNRLTATELGRLLADHRSLRLVLLNSCEGARGSQRDIFSSTASILMRRGIPAVVAMQYDITDEAAIEFAQTFYKTLTYGKPVDEAMVEARKAISFAVNNTVEWGTPVLYMRTPDGVLFDVQERARKAEISARSSLPKSRPAWSAVVLSWLHHLPLMAWIGLLGLLLLVGVVALWPGGSGEKSTPTVTLPAFAEPIIEVIPSDNPSESRVIFTEKVSQNNCGGTGDLVSTIERSQSIAYLLEVGEGLTVSDDGTIGSGLPNDVVQLDINVGAKVAAQYGVSYGEEEILSGEMKVPAKAGTNMQHTIQHVERWETGELLIAVGEREYRYLYSFRRGFAIELVASVDRGCPVLSPTVTPQITKISTTVSSETPTPTDVHTPSPTLTATPTLIVAPSKTPTPTTLAPAPTSAAVIQTSTPIPASTSWGWVLFTPLEYCPELESACVSMNDGFTMSRSKGFIRWQIIGAVPNTGLHYVGEHIGVRVEQPGQEPAYIQPHSNVLGCWFDAGDSWHPDRLLSTCSRSEEFVFYWPVDQLPDWAVGEVQITPAIRVWRRGLVKGEWNEVVDPHWEEGITLVINVGP